MTEENMKLRGEHGSHSKMVALVTDHKVGKLDTLRSGTARSHRHDAYDALLAAGEIDAVYRTTPNFDPVEFAVKTLDAGVDLLLDKPMTVSVAQCRQIIAAERRSGAKMMVAYRLQRKPGAPVAVETVQSGQPEIVLAPKPSLMQQAVESRLLQGLWSAPVADTGPHPIEAVRRLFATEPIDIFATSVVTDADPFNFENRVAVTLQVEGMQVASFVLIYNGCDVADLREIEKGDDLFAAPVDEADAVAAPMKVIAYQGESFAGMDQAGEELKYFSDYILEDRQMKTDGEEAVLDVRMLAAIEHSLKTGRMQTLAPYSLTRRTVSELMSTAERSDKTGKHDEAEQG
jgi:predicted dehydrogenase